ITVIVPTYNRGDIVKDTIECLLKQTTKDEFEYDIIVSDNNSKDDTKQIIAPYLSLYPNKLRYLFEPRQGKSYALNSALKIATGEIIACVDDDCFLEEDYLWHINRVFKQYGSEVGVMGGKIFPKWIGGEYPQWLNKIFAQSAIFENGTLNWEKIGFEGTLGILDFGEKPFVLDYSQENHHELQFY